MLVRIVLMTTLMVLLSPVTAASATGGEPSAVLEIMVKGFGVAVVAAVFVYTVLCFIRPGEQDSTHIKRRILGQDW